MDRSKPIWPQYGHQREKRHLPTSNAGRHEADQDNVSLPLPAFPPALDFDPDHFRLPPSYEEAIDIEKALHSIHPDRETGNDASPFCVPTTPSNLHFSKVQHTPELVVPAPKRHIRVIRHLRYTIFTVYRRLFTSVFVLNAIGVYLLAQQRASDAWQSQFLDTLAALASSNFLLAILVRQDYLVDLLFRVAWLVPWYVPLRLRTVVARVYCYGGIHSGAAVVGTIWWLIFTVVMSCTFLRASTFTFPIITIAWFILGLLIGIIILSLPNMRSRYHDAFEMTHRFLGWISVALFWAQLLLLAHHTSTASSKSLGDVLLISPTFWNLSLLTILLVYPWLRLRRWTFTAHLLSSHAIRLSFPHSIHKFSCLSISSSPLREWHPFATFPSMHPSEPGGSMVISSAGDWTNRVIQHATIRSEVQTNITKGLRIDGKSTEGFKLNFWVKSHPKAGVLSLSCLFPRVLILTTGSGIGPSLSSLLDRPAGQVARLIWSTRSPLETYGQHMLDLVQQADPDALVMDTNAMGRPDLLDVAWRMYKEVQAEAVFVLSNEQVTRRVVGGLEKRGIPAFGPIWDS
jgi:hypothetical protein